MGGTFKKKKPSKLSDHQELSSGLQIQQQLPNNESHREKQFSLQQQKPSAQFNSTSLYNYSSVQTMYQPGSKLVFSQTHSHHHYQQGYSQSQTLPRIQTNHSRPSTPPLPQLQSRKSAIKIASLLNPSSNNSSSQPPLFPLPSLPPLPPVFPSVLNDRPKDANYSPPSYNSTSQRNHQFLSTTSSPSSTYTSSPNLYPTCYTQEPILSSQLGVTHGVSPSSPSSTSSISSFPQSTATTYSPFGSPKVSRAGNEKTKRSALSSTMVSPPSPGSSTHSSPVSISPSEMPLSTQRAATPTNAAPSPRKFKCDVCNKRYMTAAHLTRHATIHTGARPFECPFAGCGLRFLRSDNCMQHFKTHNNPRGKTTRRMNKRQGGSTAEDIPKNQG